MSGDWSGAARSTSSLNEAKNDTGRIAFCGPYVLSAITGYSISKVEEIRRYRAAREQPVCGQGNAPTRSQASRPSAIGWSPCNVHAPAA